MRLVQHVVPKWLPKPATRLAAAYWIKSPDAPTQYLDVVISGHKAKFPNRGKWSVLTRKTLIHFPTEPNVVDCAQQSQINADSADQFL